MMSKILFYGFILLLIVNGFFWFLIEYLDYIPVVGEKFRRNFFVRTIILAGFVFHFYKKSYGKEEAVEEEYVDEGTEDGDEEEYEEEESFEGSYIEEEELDKKYANILGLKGKVTIRDIETRYREIIKKYHPDKVAMMGDELKDLAEKRTKEINEAYEYFMKKYR